MIIDFTKHLADGRIVEVFPLTFGRARLSVMTHYPALDDVW